MGGVRFVSTRSCNKQKTNRCSREQCWNLLGNSSHQCVGDATGQRCQATPGLSSDPHLLSWCLRCEVMAPLGLSWIHQASMGLSGKSERGDARLWATRALL